MFHEIGKPQQPGYQSAHVVRHGKRKLPQLIVGFNQLLVSMYQFFAFFSYQALQLSVVGF
jgi:hypothetical protein